MNKKIIFLQNAKRFILLGLLCTSLLQNSVAQNITNKGTDFWVGYGHHQFMEPPCTGGSVTNDMNMVLYLSNTETTAATVTVTIDSSGPFVTNWYKKTYTINPGQVIASENLPKGSINASASNSNPSYDARLITDPPPAGTGGEGVFRKKGIHITSNIPIVAYAHIYGSVSSGATMLLPTDAWGYSYATINSYQGDADRSYNWMYVIAKEDSTLIEIIPSQATRLGKPAGVPFQVSLNKGQIFQLVGQSDCNTGNGVQLTGTKIRSLVNAAGVCKSIAVFAGSSRTIGEQVLCGSGSGRDNDMQQCFPISAWGKTYLTAPASKSSGSGTGVSLPTNSFQTNVYKILVKDPTTVVRKNGAQLTGLINNTYYQYLSGTADYIEADKPVMVALFMSNGSNCNNSGNGDPEMIYLSPIEQAINSTGFFRNTKEAIYSNHLTLIIPTGGIPSLRIDGSPTFSYSYPHPNKLGYTVVTKNWQAAVTQCIVKSDTPFNAYTYGLGSAESYGFNAGTNLNNLSAFQGNHTPDTSSNFSTIHPYLFANTPSQIGALIAYKPQSIIWRLSGLGCSVVNPCTNVTTTNPPIDSTLVGSSKYYLYRMPSNTTFLQSGTFYLKLDLISPDPGLGDCSYIEKTKIEIIVKPTPTIDFNYTLQSGCIMDSVRFTAPSVTPENYPIIKYKWTFLNGDTSILQNPAYLFPPGQHQVNLSIITQYGGLAEITKTLNVVSGGQPHSNFGINPSTTCVGQPVTCIDSTNYTGTTSWYWDFGNGQTISAPTNVSQNVTYTTAGNYIIKHVVIGSGTAFPCAADTVRRTVIVLTTPTISNATPVSPTTCGGNNGKILLNGLTASATYLVNYLLNGSAVSPISLTANASGVITITNLSAGSYTNITVTVASCTSQPIASVIITSPNPPTAPTISSNSPVCAGNSLNLTTSITTATFTYAWSGPNGFTSTVANPTIANATTAASGAYSLNVTDIQTGCTSTTPSTINVIISANPLITNPTPTNPTVCATATGSITLNGLLSSTSYVVVYTFNATNITPVTISSNASGQVIIPNLAAGAYTNIKVSLNSCESNVISSVSLSDPNPPATPTASVLASPICAGSNINLSANSSTAGVSYEWSGPNSFTATGATASINNATVAASGTYTVIAKLNGCTSLAGSVSVVVNAIPATPSVTSNTPICAGTTLNLTSSGVVGTVSYNWSGPNTFTSTVANPTIANATTAASGSYSLTVTQNGCTSASSSISVVVNAVPTITNSTPTNPTVCATATGSITLNGLLSSTSYVVVYTFNATNITPVTISSNASGQVIIPNLAAGAYTNIKVSLNSCESNVISSVSLSDPNPPATPTILSNNSPVCSGGAIVLTANTSVLNATYNWLTPSGSTASGATLSINNATLSDAGVYKVSITVNNCTSTPTSATVVVKPTPSVLNSSSNNPTDCASDNGNIILNGFVAGTTYTLTYTKNGVVQNASIVANTNGAIVVSNLFAATYDNVIVTLNGCSSTAVGPFVLSDPNPPATPTITATPNDTICVGNNLTLTANTTTTGNIIYTWSANNAFNNTTNNPIVFNNAAASVSGIYSVTASLNGCTSATATIPILVYATPIISNTTITHPTNCASSTGSITLKGLANNTNYIVSYTFNASVQTITSTTNASGDLIIPSLPAGTYSNIFVTLGQCPSANVGPVTLTDPAPPGVSIITNNSPLCEGATLNIEASSAAGVTYAWTSTNGYIGVGSSVTINPVSMLSSGTYTITAIKNNCVSTASAVVSVKPYPLTDFSISPYVCMPNGVVSFTNLTTMPDGTTPTYLWNFGDATALNTTTNPTHIYATANNYTITLKAIGGNGCSKTISKTFDKFFDKPIASFKVDKDTICVGPISYFTDLSTAPNSTVKSWLWNFGNGNETTIQNPSNKYIAPGNYIIQLVVSSNENCISDTIQKTVKVFQQPIIDAGQSFYIPAGTTLMFNPIVNDTLGIKFLWTPTYDFIKPDTLFPTLIVTHNQTYYLLATGEWKCTAIDSLKVIALKRVFVPNVFTPNGDNIHDKWDIEELKDYPFVEVEVFNRNGQKVYQSSGYTSPWDGTLNGKPLPVATYYYIIDFKNNFPKQAGAVTILR